MLPNGQIFDLAKSPMPRIVLCSSGGLYGALVLNCFLSDSTVDVVGIVRSTRVLNPRYGWLRGAFEQLRLSGSAYTLYLGCATTLPDALGRWSGVSSLAVSARRRRIPLYATRNLNEPTAVDFVAELQPDLLVSAFFNQRIGESISGLPSAGAVNIHPSLLPDYKGVDPVFHARLRGETRLGVTVHRIEPAFDTGPLLIQHEVEVADHCSLMRATAQLFVRGARSLLDFLPDLMSGAPGCPQRNGGRYDSWPTPEQVSSYRRSGHELVSTRDWQLLVSAGGGIDLGA